VLATNISLLIVEALVITTCSFLISWDRKNWPNLFAVQVG